MTNNTDNIEKHAGGRPTLYNLEIADRICERLIAGESLNAITKDPSMPCISTVYKWRNEHIEFSNKYEKAREDQIDTFVHELTEISDNDDEGKVQRDRLKIETRKWIAERMKPKKYGAVQKLEVEDITITPEKRKGILERLRSRKRT